MEENNTYQREEIEVKTFILKCLIGVHAWVYCSLEFISQFQIIYLQSNSLLMKNDRVITTNYSKNWNPYFFHFQWMALALIRNSFNLEEWVSFLISSVSKLLIWMVSIQKSMWQGEASFLMIFAKRLNSFTKSKENRKLLLIPHKLEKSSWYFAMRYFSIQLRCDRSNFSPYQIITASCQVYLNHTVT